MKPTAPAGPVNRGVIDSDLLGRSLTTRQARALTATTEGAIHTSPTSSDPVPSLLPASQNSPASVAATESLTIRSFGPSGWSYAGWGTYDGWNLTPASYLATVDDPYVYASTACTPTETMTVSSPPISTIRCEVGYHLCGKTCVKGTGSCP
jgi:hypothetical protein